MCANTSLVKISFTLDETGASDKPTVSGALHTDVPTKLSGFSAFPLSSISMLTPKSHIFISSNSPEKKIQFLETTARCFEKFD